MQLESEILSLDPIYKLMWGVLPSRLMPDLQWTLVDDHLFFV